jgi:hypothetical protein
MKFAITVTRFFYGPENKLSLLSGDSEAHHLEFDSRANARDEISRREGGTYYLGHNESGHPDYKIVQVGSRAFRRAFRHANGGLEWRAA